MKKPVPPVAFDEEAYRASLRVRAASTAEALKHAEESPRRLKLPPGAVDMTHERLGQTIGIIGARRPRKREDT